MKPTDVLKTEHQAITRMLKILESVCGRLESDRDVDAEHIDRMIDFFRVFADKCHHGKEEDILFPAMEEAGVARESGPVGAMLKEHDIGRDNVKGMSDALGGYKTGDAAASALFIKNAREYITLLDQHIMKEDDVLFILADARLPEDEQERILAEFEIIENDNIGSGKHDEFHQLLAELESVYLE